MNGLQLNPGTRFGAKLQVTWDDFDLHERGRIGSGERIYEIDQIGTDTLEIYLYKENGVAKGFIEDKTVPGSQKMNFENEKWRAFWPLPAHYNDMEILLNHVSGMARTYLKFADFAKQYNVPLSALMEQFNIRFRDVEWPNK